MYKKQNLLKIIIGIRIKKKVLEKTVKIKRKKYLESKFCKLLLLGLHYIF